MNDVRQTWLVAAREIRERGRSRAFLASLLLMLLVVAAAIALPALLDTGPGTKDVGLTGATAAGLTAAVQAQGDTVDTTIRIPAATRRVAPQIQPARPAGLRRQVRPRATPHHPRR